MSMSMPTQTKTKMKSRPQIYPRAPFHCVRAISIVCSGIVSGILIYFCAQLKQDGFKLPWTFILVLAATLSSLLTLLLTSIIYFCAFLSPLFNLVLNVLILLIWTVSLALLTYNMYGTLGHSCSRANWASADGIMICRTYKAMFSFFVFGWLAQLAQIILDVRSRRAQTAQGTYDRMMADLNGGGGGDGAGLLKEQDLKLDTLHSRDNSSASVSVSAKSGFLSVDDAGHANSADAAVPYGVQLHDYGGRDGEAGWGRRDRPNGRETETEPQARPLNNRQVQRSESGYTAQSHVRPAQGQTSLGEDTVYGYGYGNGNGNGYGRNAAPVRRAENHSYDRYAPQIGYANTGYGYGNGYGNGYGYGPQQ